MQQQSEGKRTDGEHSEEEKVCEELAERRDQVLHGCLVDVFLVDHVTRRPDACTAPSECLSPCEKL